MKEKNVGWFVACLSVGIQSETQQNQGFLALVYAFCIGPLLRNADANNPYYP
ncbi:hypothetical protein BDGGKGIB_01587 [Nodularia sphaerocarpa UHCC 0038]|nr:hypothetical protein BDGGKGIB_01587 [Nodularia sphaerocarpa UHCC 0038]